MVVLPDPGDPTNRQIISHIIADQRIPIRRLTALPRFSVLILNTHSTNVQMEFYRWHPGGDVDPFGCVGIGARMKL